MQNGGKNEINRCNSSSINIIHKAGVTDVAFHQ